MSDTPIKETDAKHAASTGANGAMLYPMPHDAATFCHVNKLSGPLGICIQLVRANLGLVEEPAVYLAGDPETDEQWLVVRVMTRGRQEQASAAYENFVRQWVVAADFESRKKIRLSCNISSQ